MISFVFLSLYSLVTLTVCQAYFNLQSPSSVSVIKSNQNFGSSPINQKVVLRPRDNVICMGTGNTFGKIFRISTYGESHGGGVGVIIDGCPPRIPLSSKEIQTELDRRRPGMFLRII